MSDSDLFQDEEFVLDPIKGEIFEYSRKFNTFVFVFTLGDQHFGDFIKERRSETNAVYHKHWIADGKPLSDGHTND